MVDTLKPVIEAPPSPEKEQQSALPYESSPTPQAIEEESGEPGSPQELAPLESILPPTEDTATKVIEGILVEDDGLSKGQKGKSKQGDSEVTRGYLGLVQTDPPRAQLFKARGELIAHEINALLNTPAGHSLPEQKLAQAVFPRIYDWLKLLGGSDPYLIQEAKLKTDSILEHGRSLSTNQSP